MSPIFPPQIRANNFAIVPINDHFSIANINFQVFNDAKFNPGTDFIQQFVHIVIADVVLHVLQHRSNCFFLTLFAHS